MGVAHVSELFDLFNKSVETNMSLNDMLPLINIAPQLTEPGKVKQYFIGPGQVQDYIVPQNGAMVLLPNKAAIHNIIWEAAFTK